MNEVLLNNPLYIHIVWMVSSPYHLLQYVVWCVRWWWRFSVRREEYGEEERAYLTRKKLKMSESMWQVNNLHETMF